MVVTPHPDDAELGCGGTIAGWIAQGTEVVYVLCTNGDKATGDPDMTSERLAEIREVEQAEALDARSVTGRITVGRCSGRCQLLTKSGRITCDSAGDASISTLSGRIRLGDATGKVLAQSVSGKVEARTQGNDDVAIQTLSGSVRVEVPKDVRPNARLKSMTGRPRCDCEEGDDIQIAVRSMSGKIEVVPF